MIRSYLKAHFGAHPPERPGLEVCGAHPILECAEDVFNGASSDGHRIGFPVESTLYGSYAIRFQNEASHVSTNFLYSTIDTASRVLA